MAIQILGANCTHQRSKKTVFVQAADFPILKGDFFFRHQMELEPERATEQVLQATALQSHQSFFQQIEFNIWSFQSTKMICSWLCWEISSYLLVGLEQTFPDSCIFSKPVRTSHILDCIKTVAAFGLKLFAMTVASKGGSSGVDGQGHRI